MKLLMYSKVLRIDCNIGHIYPIWQVTIIVCVSIRIFFNEGRESLVDGLVIMCFISTE